MKYVTDRCKALGMISLHVLIINVQQLREASCSAPQLTESDGSDFVSGIATNYMFAIICL